MEELITNVSHALDYAKEMFNLKIGKKPKHLIKQYKGPDVYSTLGLLATEVVEFPHTMTSKINSEKANVQVDFQKFQSKMEQDLKNARSECTDLFQKGNVQVDLQKLQSKMEQDLKNVRSEFTDLFWKIKISYTCHQQSETRYR